MNRASNTHEKVWSRTRPKVFRVEHEWIIDDFLGLTSNVTVEFKVGTEEDHEICLKLDLRLYNTPDKDKISLYLYNLNEVSLEASVVFETLNSDRIAKDSLRLETRTFEPGGAWGFSDFCSRREIIRHASKMLPEGSMTILTQICILRLGGVFDSHAVTTRYAGCTVSPDNSSCLSKDLMMASKKMNHHDMALCCAGNVYPCHKFMLAARSDVFSAMFAHDMQEAKDGRVDIPDSSPRAIEQFLEYIYTDTFDDKSFVTVMQLLSLADKYNVKGLRALCVPPLLSKMSVKNVIEVAKAGTLYNNSTLQSQAFAFISKNFDAVADTAAWKQLFQHAPDIYCQVNRLAGGNPKKHQSRTRRTAETQ